MKAFVVSLNGQPFVTAGIGDDGVLTAHVTWVGGSAPRPATGHLRLHVGGLDSRTQEHARWSTPQIKVGDRVTIEITETDQVTPEDARFPVDESRHGNNHGNVEREGTA